MQIKGLTLHEPFATMFRLGLKTKETRTWYPTKFRGLVAIHAAKDKKRLRDLASHMAFGNAKSQPDKWILSHTAEIKEAALRIGDELKDDKLKFHPGEALAVGELYHVSYLETQGDIDEYSEQEQALGWFKLGTYVWHFRDVVTIQPLRMNGAQGLWDVDSNELVRRYKGAIGNARG